MIKLDSFIKSVHDAILSANDKLVDKNLEVLEVFFEEDINKKQKIQTSFNEAVTEINEVLLQENMPEKQKLAAVLKSLEEVKEALRHDDTVYSEENKKNPSGLVPKMTTIQYPHKTDSGVVMSDVQVPLITLVPLSMTQISEVRIRTDLELQVKDEELLVSFPVAQAGTVQDDLKARSTATIEIVLTPHHGTEGLKKIVEGYEKVLRAQIPN